MLFYRHQLLLQLNHNAFVCCCCFFSFVRCLFIVLPLNSLWQLHRVSSYTTAVLRFLLSFVCLFSKELFIFILLKFIFFPELVVFTPRIFPFRIVNGDDIVVFSLIRTFPDGEQHRQFHIFFS